MYYDNFVILSHVISVKTDINQIIVLNITFIRKKKREL